MNIVNTSLSYTWKLSCVEYSRKPPPMIRRLTDKSSTTLCGKSPSGVFPRLLNSSPTMRRQSNGVVRLFVCLAALAVRCNAGRLFKVRSLILAVICALTAWPVAACDDGWCDHIGEDYRHRLSTPCYVDTSTVSYWGLPKKAPDTLRYYPVVDTCLSCDSGWTLTISDTLWNGPNYFNQVTKANAERWCFNDASPTHWQETKRPYITTQTTWLPKEQVWLTPEEKKRLNCFIKWGDHRFTDESRISYGQPLKYVCVRCKAEVAR